MYIMKVLEEWRTKWKLLFRFRVPVWGLGFRGLGFSIFMGLLWPPSPPSAYVGTQKLRARTEMIGDY